jgi:hypothetical protein
VESEWGLSPILLKAVLEDHPEFKVVIIDTLQKFARITDIKDYTETVTTLSVLKKIADDLGIAIIVIHHNRKGSENGGGDWMEGGLGSIGINATADCTITLTRKRESTEGFLRATGRDIAETHWALTWNKDICSWSIADDMPTGKPLTPDQQEVLRYMAENGQEPITTGEIASALHKPSSTISGILKRLQDLSLVIKPKYGLWALPSFVLSTSLREDETAKLHEPGADNPEQDFRPNQAGTGREPALQTEELEIW